MADMSSNTHTYMELIKSFPLRRIKTDAMHAKATSIVLRLSGQRTNRGTAEYLDILIDLIVDYEKRSGQTVDTSNISAAEQVRQSLHEIEDNMDLDTWASEITSTASGNDAAKDLQRETDLFFKAYQQCKSRSELHTIRAVAEAAGLSPTTVQAIEKQRVKPQFRTIQALAKAFNVDPEILNGNAI